MLGDTHNIKIEKIKSNYSTETINLPVLIMLNNPAELVLAFYSCNNVNLFSF